MKPVILVVAEHNGKHISPSTHRTITAARQIGEEIHLVVIGDERVETLASEAAKLDSVTRVLTVSAQHLAHPIAENWAQEIVMLANNHAATHVLAPASAFGKNILPRVAAVLDVAQVSEVLEIQAPNRFVRPIYAGNAWSTVESQQERHVLTIRTTCFDPISSTRSVPAEIVAIEPASAPLPTFLLKQELNEGGRPELTNARVVVSGGYALGSADNFKLIEQLADKLGGAVGASRAAVDAGFVPNDYQIGQTGKVVAPDLYIAIGISGQVQHLAGMKGSKVIVAINKDADAPIFNVADYGLVADLFEVLPQLTAQL